MMKSTLAKQLEGAVAIGKVVVKVALTQEIRPEDLMDLSIIILEFPVSPLHHHPNFCPFSH